MSTMTHRSDVHVDKVLTNLLQGRKSGSNIADKILPPLGVDADSGIFFTWGRGEIDIAGLDTLKAPRSKPKEVDFGAEQSTYSLEPHGLSTFLRDDVVDNSEPILGIRDRKAQKTEAMLDRAYEKSVATTVLSTATYGPSNYTTLTGNDQWSALTHASSDPLADIEAGKIAIHKATGFWPNRILFDATDLLKFKRHDKVKASLQYTSKTGIDHIPDSEIAAFLGIPELIVADALENTANPGQTESIDYIWQGSVLMWYANPSTNPAKDEPSFGYKFFSKKARREVLRYRENGEEGEHIYVRERRAAKICMADAAYLIKDAFA
jgi:hypothetical protein